MCGFKICNRCGIEQSLDDFYTRKYSKDGYNNRCKTCCDLLRNKCTERLVHIEITEKHCKSCNITKSVTEFYKNKRIKDGYGSACKQCSDKSKKNRSNNFVEPSKNVIEKHCSTCDIIKSISEFNIDRYTKDGYSTTCKSCTNKRPHNRIIYNNVTHNLDETKQCCRCKEIKNINEFYPNNRCKDGLASKCKICSTEYNRNHRHKKPELYKVYDHKKRHFGYNPINKIFNWSDAHHLHLEDNHDFVLHIPCWLHRLYSHNSYTWKNMNHINAIALDFWINENFYKNLYEL